MFGGGNVKLEATITIDISKTEILFFPRCTSVCQSSVLRISPWWSSPPLIIRHFILPQPNPANRGDS